MTERYCFMSDEDGHWYLVKMKDRELFDTLLYDETDEEYDNFNEHFSDCRLEMNVSNYSFTDCNEIG